MGFSSLFCSVRWHLEILGELEFVMNSLRVNFRTFVALIFLSLQELGAEAI